MKEFLKKILLLTAVVLATVSVMALCNLYFSPIYYPVTIYFLISVVLMYYVFHNIMQKNPKRFSSMFLLISFGKMFLGTCVLRKKTKQPADLEKQRVVLTYVRF